MNVQNPKIYSSIANIYFFVCFTMFSCIEKHITYSRVESLVINDTSESEYRMKVFSSGLYTSFLP